MQSIRIYDLPTRLFHWSFAVLFITAFAIANLFDDESSYFSWHMLAGLMLVAAVALRLIWGVVGTRHARFSDLALGPSQLVGYLKSVVVGGSRRWVGHNPASSWAALVMMALALAMAASGVAMSLGTAPEWIEEVHEVMANVFLAVALLHLAGLAAHVLRHRDALPLSMLTGRKRNLPAETVGVPSRGIVAVLMLVALLGLGGLLWKSYDAETGTLDLFGFRLALSENEGMDGPSGGAEQGEMASANEESGERDGD